MRKYIAYLILVILSIPFKTKAEENNFDDLKASKNDPTDFSADKVIYDDKNKKVIAIGNVEAVHEGAILVADRLEYDMVKDIIIAKDNVVISYSDGKTVFSDRAEVSSDFKKGLAENIIIKNSDGSSFTAKYLKSESDKVLKMKRTSYTPCDLCEGKSPSWQLKARKATYEQEEEKTTYTHAYLDIFGAPLFYVPYFSYTNDKSDSKTGFLTPRFGNSSNLGFMFSTPFFVHINDHHKMTLTPTYLSKENPLYQGEYNGITNHSNIDFNGYYINQKDSNDRHYINTNITTHYNSYFRSRMDVHNISDETFLKVYSLPNDEEPWLMSEVALDGFSRNSNFNMTYYHFKDLRADVENDTMPEILPSINYNYISDPSRFGSFYNVNVNTLMLTRKQEGKERETYQRYTTELEYNLPLNGAIGEKYNLSASVRGDLYRLDDTINPEGDTYSDTKAKAYPELAFETSYPFERTDYLSTQIIEPTATFITSPNQKEIDILPNEDSREFELNDTNILTNNRYTGYDKVETGTRVNYGLNWNIYGHSGYTLTNFIGQSYRFTEKNDFPTNSGLEDNFSDYVGAMSFYGYDFLNMDYRYRLQKEDLKMNRSELDLNVGNSFLRTNIRYLFIESSSSQFSDFKDREELNLGLGSNLTQYIKAYVSTKRNLIADETIENKFRIGYEDECMSLSLNLKKDLTNDRDYKGDTSVMLVLELKTLGVLRTGDLTVE
ncbi:MAG: LPS-assembly protein LptD precursor [Alphaproteobacteria bacterium ADurb.Bin438]|nr:MAG: LPS-assembly protein LptD precursor [Alphaproteobacteria bacterium ADurb.Bin438]